MKFNLFKQYRQYVIRMNVCNGRLLNNLNMSRTSGTFTILVVGDVPASASIESIFPNFKSLLCQLLQSTRSRILFFELPSSGFMYKLEQLQIYFLYILQICLFLRLQLSTSHAYRNYILISLTEIGHCLAISVSGKMVEFNSNLLYHYIVRSQLKSQQ